MYILLGIAYESDEIPKYSFLNHFQTLFLVSHSKLCTTQKTSQPKTFSKNHCVRGTPELKVSNTPKGLFKSWC